MKRKKPTKGERTTNTKKRDWGGTSFGMYAHVGLARGEEVWGGEPDEEFGETVERI